MKIKPSKRVNGINGIVYSLELIYTPTKNWQGNITRNAVTVMRKLPRSIYKKSFVGLKKINPIIPTIIKNAEKKSHESLLLT